MLSGILCKAVTCVLHPTAKCTLVARAALQIAVQRKCLVRGIFGQTIFLLSRPFARFTKRCPNEHKEPCRTILGFVWPAYQCFKDVEHKKSNHKQWIVIVLYSAAERFSDLFLFWFAPSSCHIQQSLSILIPLYSEAKIGLVYFLACANGAEYIYSRTVAPLLIQHEAQIDDKIAKGQAWVQAHISANFSWIAESIQSRMLGMISAVHQFQKDHQTMTGTAPSIEPVQKEPWSMPAGQTAIPQSDTSAKGSSRRRFGLGR